MVTFDSRVAGTSRVDWDESPIRSLPVLDLSDVDRVIVVGAHPDDETLGAGGLIARCARGGVPVRVVVATDGGATGAPGIARRRSLELRSALTELHPESELIELGLPDGRLDSHRPQLLTALRRALAVADARTLIVAPWVGDGHRDHRIVGELVAVAARRRRVVAYPIWMWHWSSPDDSTLPWSRMRTVTIDVPIKQRALARYESQREGSAPMLRADFLEHFDSDCEVFIVADDPIPEPRLESIPGSYFDDLYGRHDDPWGFLTRWYEERKRDVTLASLLERRYASALEVGCSIGVLTERLARRCDDLLAVDVSPAAVELARERVAGVARVEALDVGTDFPDGTFDLVVLSEVGYYFQGDGLDRVLASVRNALAPGGELIACHWRHAVVDYPTPGDEVHARLRGLGLARVVHHVEDDFVLEVFSRDGSSVASREGLA